MSFSGRRVSILPASNRRFSTGKDLSLNGTWPPSSSFSIFHINRQCSNSRTHPTHRTPLRNPSSIPKRPRRTPTSRWSRSLPCLNRCRLVYRTRHWTRLCRRPFFLGKPRPGCPRGRRRDRGQFPPSHVHPHHLCFARVWSHGRYQASAGGGG